MEGSISWVKAQNFLTAEDSCDTRYQNFCSSAGRRCMSGKWNLKGGFAIWQTLEKWKLTHCNVRYSSHAAIYLFSSKSGRDYGLHMEHIPEMDYYEIQFFFVLLRII